MTTFNVGDKVRVIEGRRPGSGMIGTVDHLRPGYNYDVAVKGEFGITFYSAGELERISALTNHQKVEKMYEKADRLYWEHRNNDDDLPAEYWYAIRRGLHAALHPDDRLGEYLLSEDS